VESTALGAACLVGFAVGVFKSLQDITNQWESESIFTPQIEEAEREKRLTGWRRALSRAMGWEEK
jgi:glycerol kinase